MNEDQAFLNAILADPTDRTLRLIYADWLEERGDRRSDYLRLQCQLEDLPADSPERIPLRKRADDLRAQLPTNWLTALDGPMWCIAANVVFERAYGPGGAETRRGTKHFAPGAKVFVCDHFWGMGGEDVTVIGRHRKSNQYITLSMKAEHLANWRAELVYAPAVIKRVLECGGELGRLPRGSEQSKKRAEEIVAIYNRRGAKSQPFVTRTRAPDPSAE